MKHNYIFLTGYISKINVPFTSKISSIMVITFKIITGGIECNCCTFGEKAEKIFTTDLGTKVVAEGRFTKIKEQKYIYISRIETYTHQKINIEIKNLKVDYLEEIILNEKGKQQK